MDRLKNQIKQFRDDTEAGIDLVLPSDSWDDEEDNSPQMLPARFVDFLGSGDFFVPAIPVLFPIPVCNPDEDEKSADVDEPVVSPWMKRCPVKCVPVPNSPAWKITKLFQDRLPRLDYQIWKSADGLSGTLVVPAADNQEIRLEVQRSKVSGQCKVLVDNKVCIDTTRVKTSEQGYPLKTFETIAVGFHSVDVCETEEGNFEVFVDEIPFHQLDLLLESWSRTNMKSTFKV